MDENETRTRRKKINDKELGRAMSRRRLAQDSVSQKS